VVAFAAMRNLTFMVLVLACACGSSTTGMSGPTVTGKLEDGSDETPKIQSNDILARDAATKKAGVKHVLIGWRELSANMQSKLDERAAKRDRAEADTLAVDILKRCSAGEDIDKLMADYSEDSGSAKSARVYDVTADAKLVFEFKRLSLRLKLGECGLVQSPYGWHVIKRVE
jgi:PPIC-type PPIASE domain